MAALVAGYEALAAKTKDAKTATADLNAAEASLTNTKAGLASMTKEQVAQAEDLTKKNIALAESHLAAAKATLAHIQELEHLGNLTSVVVSAWDALFGGSKKARGAVDEETEALGKLNQQLKILEDWKEPKTPKLGALADAAPKKDKGEQSKMSKLQEEFDADQNKHNDMITNMQAAELAYWQKIKDHAKDYALTKGEFGEVDIKVQTLTHQLAIQGLKDQMAAARETSTVEIAGIQEAAAQQKAKIDEQIKGVEEAEKRGEVSHESAHATIMRLIEEQRQAAITAATAIYSARAAADEAIMSISAQNTAEYKAAAKDEEAAGIARDKAVVASKIAADKQVTESNKRRPKK